MSIDDDENDRRKKELHYLLTCITLSTVARMRGAEWGVAASNDALALLVSPALSRASDGSQRHMTGVNSSASIFNEDGLSKK